MNVVNKRFLEKEKKMEEKKVKVSKDAVEYIDGKMVIKDQEVLEKIQDELGMDITAEDAQNAFVRQICIY